MQRHGEVFALCVCQGWVSLLTLPPRRRRELPQHYPSPSMWSFYTVAPGVQHLASLRSSFPGVVSIAPAVQRPDPSSPPTVCLELPSLTNIFQAPCPTLKHVPKGVRDRWARVFKDCLSAVCDAPADLSRWSKLFMLAKCVLASPATGHRLHWREILALVRSRIDRWLAGDLVALWLEAVAGGKSLAKRVQSSSGSQQSSNIRRAKLAVQDGQYSKAIKALTSDGLATPSAEVLEEMLGKHPQVAPPNLPSGQVPPPFTVSELAVKKGVRSFPNGSAPGPSGLRPSHLREAVGCPSPDRANRFLSSLTSFLNLLAGGRAPPTIIPHLCGASVLAYRKKNGGHRPIAVGEVLRRLVSKCLAYVARSSAISLLAPLQLGVSVQGGCEAIVHATSQLMTSVQDNQHWTLLLDFSNAFNSISREAMFVECRRRLPGLSAWMESCYSCLPLLHLGRMSSTAAAVCSRGILWVHWGSP